MHFADLVRSFLPLRNPIGFGASDFLELIIAALLVLLALISRRWLEPYARRLAPKTGWCMLLLLLLPIALRLALLSHHPVPTPDVYDEFGHLLVADTLRHFRLANPPHPLHQFFETFFVLQQPTYSSIYPLGQGLSMAIGRMIFGIPWAGVLLSTAAFCSLCYWMLRGWTTPLWSLLGGLLAVIEFGPLNPWMNSYWGGAFSATAGCLVFGAIPRLREAASPRNAALLGLGLALQLITRPYELIFLLAAVLFLVPIFRKPARLIPALLVLLPAIALSLLQNKRVTGSWTTFPYVLSQYQYGVPTGLTFQPNPVPHNDLTPQQQLDYKMQLAFRPSGPETIATYLTRLAYRVRFYRFFFLAPLYIALPAFFFGVRESRFAGVALTLIIFALGVNFYPLFLAHYIAAVTCLFVLVSVVGLQQLNRLTIRGWPAGNEAARLILFLCGVHFIFWYGLHIFDTADVSVAMRRYETWDAINHANPERRIEVNERLANVPGKLLVFVRYSPQHIFQDEWVYNEADIDRARIVWARDLGATEDQKLQHYYPDRAVWLLEPDDRPPRLSLYQPEPPPANPQPPTLQLEQVH
jgi:hypothetical protein